MFVLYLPSSFEEESWWRGVYWDSWCTSRIFSIYRSAVGNFPLKISLKFLPLTLGEKQLIEKALYFAKDVFDKAVSKQGANENEVCSEKSLVS